MTILVKMYLIARRFITEDGKLYMSDDVKISKLMTYPVLKIDEQGTIREAIAFMSEKQVGSLLVTRHGAEVGILTEKDILSKVIAQNQDTNQIKAGDVMSSPLITVEKDTTGENALRTMVEYRVR